MRILQVPKIYQPGHLTQYKYIPYSSGQHTDEIMFEYLFKNKDNIKTNLIYVPIFWSKLYYSRSYGEKISDLLDFLDNNLKPNEKYFTIVSYDSGVFVRNLKTKLILFSACGGSLNLPNKKLMEKDIKIDNQPRVIYTGNTGDFCIPLMVKPLFKYDNTKKDIFCSFVGKFSNHPCRIIMQKVLKNNQKYLLKYGHPGSGYRHLKKIMDRSIFTLCPRGYGYTSYRLFECMLCESIPIFIWEDKYVLPYEDVIDWKEICILINSKDLHKLPTILDNLTDKQINDMRNKIREYNKKYFHFDYMYEYIKNKITQF